MRALYIGTKVSGLSPHRTGRDAGAMPAATQGLPARRFGNGPVAPMATGLSAPPAVGSHAPVIIGPANDAAEREAERIAGTVASPMSVSSPVSSIGESRRSEGTQAGPAARPVVAPPSHRPRPAVERCGASLLRAAARA